MPAHRSFLILSAATGVALLSTHAANAAGDPTGVWFNDTGRGAIEIKNCGGSLCGHVVWVKDTTDTRGCGRQIIGDAAKVGANVWDNGWIYNPDKKKKYDVELKPLSNGTLQVTGYAGTKLFSKTMIWKRAPADLVRCGTEETVAKTDAKPKTDVKQKSETVSKPATNAADKTAEPAAKPDAKIATKTSPAVTAEPKIVPPAPVPAERPAKKPADPAPSVPVEVARSEPAPDTPQSGAAPKPATENAEASADGKDVPQVHALPGIEDEKDAPVVNAEEEEADQPRIDMGKIAKRLAELERETGYGLKKSGNGNCRLKVPYATVNFPCRD